MLTVRIVFEIGGVFFLGFRNEWLVWLWKCSSDPRSEAEADFLLQCSHHESLFGMYQWQLYIVDPEYLLAVDP